MTTATTNHEVKFIAGGALFARWQDDVRNGTGPVVFPHTLPVPAVSPGSITLLGGAPGAGKTALAMQVVVEAMRYTDTLRVLVANVEMSPESLLDRQLSRLSGIEAEVIRRRQVAAAHADRLVTGMDTIGSFVDRLAFLESPFDLQNVARAATKHRADIIVLDYIQRIARPDAAADSRLRVNDTMDCLRECASTGIAVIAVSAVGRSRDNKGRSSYSAEGMGLASFRESSELEYGADDAFLLAAADQADENHVRLSHLKCRHGAQRSVDLNFDRARQAFRLIDDTVDARPGLPTRRGKRGPKPQCAMPDPAFLPERLAELWKSTPAAPGDAAADNGGDG